MPPFFMRYIIIGTGASLSQAQVDACRDKGKVIVINEAYMLAPWADYLYACDVQWWEHFYADVKAKFKGEMWGQIQKRSGCERERNFYKDHPDINTVWSLTQEGYSHKPGYVYTGAASGYQAIQLADQFGAKQILLVGFDGKKGTAIRDREAKFTKASPYGIWQKRMQTAVKECRAELLNCTPDSAYKIKYIPLVYGLESRVPD